MTKSTFIILRYDVDGHDENVGMLPYRFYDRSTAMSAAGAIAAAETGYTTADLEIDTDRSMVMLSDEVTFVVEEVA